MVSALQEAGVQQVGGNCRWPRSALEMDSSPLTLCLHRATDEQGHSRLHQSRDVMLCLPSAAKER